MSKGFKSFFITFVLACVLFAYGATYIFDNYVDAFIESLFGIAKSDSGACSNTGVYSYCSQFCDNDSIFIGSLYSGAE